MAEQEMLLDSATIKAAVAGEKWATEKVIEHYAPMIDELAVDEDRQGRFPNDSAHPAPQAPGPVWRAPVSVPFYQGTGADTLCEWHHRFLFL